MAAAVVSYHVGREGNSVYGETLNGVQTHRVPYGHSFFRPLEPHVVPGDKTSGLLFGVQPEPPGDVGAGDHRVQAYCFRLVMTDVPENQLYGFRLILARSHLRDRRRHEMLHAPAKECAR